MKNVEIFYPQNTTDWRQWLEKNHASSDAVWLIFYSKKSGKNSIIWSDAVDVALCFGWIDSKKIKIDPETFHQFFSRRKPNSTWSKINKEKVDLLISEGLMTHAGLQSIEAAKKNGSWSVLDEVEALLIPKDLEAAFKLNENARSYFLSLSKSKRKILLTWIVMAKRSETRASRINEIFENAVLHQMPKNFRT